VEAEWTDPVSGYEAFLWIFFDFRLLVRCSSMLIRETWSYRILITLVGFVGFEVLTVFFRRCSTLSIWWVEASFWGHEAELEQQYSGNHPLDYGLISSILGTWRPVEAAQNVGQQFVSLGRHLKNCG
jgi:hypothetical protein